MLQTTKLGIRQKRGPWCAGRSIYVNSTSLERVGCYVMLETKVLLFILNASFKFIFYLMYQFIHICGVPCHPFNTYIL